VANTAPGWGHRLFLGRLQRPWVAAEAGRTEAGRTEEDSRGGRLNRALRRAVETGG